MNNLTISIFGNQIFLDIIEELKLFPKSKIKSYQSVSLHKNNEVNCDEIFIFFTQEKNKEDYEEFKKKNFPLIIITKFPIKRKISSNDLVEQIGMPFSILELKKKIVLLLSRYRFKKSSLINLNNYIIDQNERKLKKNDLELQLTEKEINFLILFSKNKKPLSRSFVLKNVWNYSSDSETHTVETHIHRLRNKILKKFDDNNFIKNNDKGYFI